MKQAHIKYYKNFLLIILILLNIGLVNAFYLIDGDGYNILNYTVNNSMMFRNAENVTLKVINSTHMVSLKAFTSYMEVKNILNHTGSFTATMWILPTGCNYAGLIAKDKTGNRDWFLSHDAGTPACNLRVRIYNSSGTQFQVDSDLVAPAGNWSFVAFSYNSVNGLVKMYVNDQLDVNTMNVIGARANTNENLTIGKTLSDDYIFDGGIDSVRIYNRTLTDDEIFKIYNRKKDNTDEVFNIVVLPDTQGYSEHNPSNFTNQTNWTVVTKNSMFNTFVLHTGDIVDDPNITQYNNANTSISVMDGKIPYFLSYGNHDDDNGRNTTLYNNYFGRGRYNASEYWGGSMNETMDNYYSFINVSGIKFMILSLEFCPRNITLNWANSTVYNNSDRKVIVLTHSYMNYDNTRIEDGDTYSCNSYGMDNDGEELWNNYFKYWANLSFVISGHMLFDGNGYLASTGVNGNTVHQILQNYQMYSNNGNGWLRYYRFTPSQDLVEAFTYSTTLNQFNTSSDQQFNMTWEMEDYVYKNYNDLLGFWLLNEGTGYEAFDVSKYAKKGDLTLGFWDDDGILVTLRNGIDYFYSKTASIFRVINPKYFYSVANVTRADYNSSEFAIINNTLGTARLINAINLVDALMYHSNGSVICSDVTLCDNNKSFTVPNNKSAYIFDNFNCSEFEQSSSGYPCGREYSPINISSKVESGNTLIYIINNISNIAVPFIINATQETRNCNDLTQVLVNSIPVSFTCSSPLRFTGTLNSGTNVITLVYSSGESSMCTGLLGGIDNISPIIPIMLMIISIVVLIGLAGALLFIYNGNRMNQINFSISDIIPYILGIGALIFVVIIVLIIASTVCSLA